MNDSYEYAVQSKVDAIADLSAEVDRLRAELAAAKAERGYTIQWDDERHALISRNVLEARDILVSAMGVPDDPGGSLPKLAKMAATGIRNKALDEASDWLRHNLSNGRAIATRIEKLKMKP